MTITHPENLIKGKRYEFKHKVGQFIATMTGTFVDLWICGGEIKITFDCDSELWKGVRGHLPFRGTNIQEI